MSEIMRQQRDLGLSIVGPYGTLHAYKPEDQSALNEATGNPFAAMVTGMALFAQAPPIYGGTDQVQRNIIGERVLGLPKEANNDKTAAFKDLPKNAWSAGDGAVQLHDVGAEHLVDLERCEARAGEVLGEGRELRRATVTTGL